MSKIFLISGMGANERLFKNLSFSIVSIIKNAIVIPNGTHLMVFTRGDEISKIIKEKLN